MDGAHLIAGHEGLRLHVYPDPAPPHEDTIAYGQHIVSLSSLQSSFLISKYGSIANVYKNGITPDDAMWLLESAVHVLEGQLNSLWLWFKELSQNRQAVLLDMTYEMGIGSLKHKTGIQGFHNMLDAISKGDWVRAIKEMDASPYSSKVPGREKNNKKLLLDG
jgi:GH24 family phage-related lysozyme (muramidase)